VSAKNGDQSSQSPKAPAIAQALAEIDRAREDVALQVSALREEISRTVDWREWYRRRPGLCLATAFALGYWIGRRT
jgi:hypothetical protein